LLFSSPSASYLLQCNFKFFLLLKFILILYLLLFYFCRVLLLTVITHIHFVYRFWLRKSIQFKLRGLFLLVSSLSRFYPRLLIKPTKFVCFCLIFFIFIRFLIELFRLWFFDTHFLLVLFLNRNLLLMFWSQHGSQICVFFWLHSWIWFVNLVKCIISSWCMYLLSRHVWFWRCKNTTIIFTITFCFSSSLHF